MKNAPNFCIQEFVPKSVFSRYGKNSIWFVNPKIPILAQFFKDYLIRHFKKPMPGDSGGAKTVIVTINNWKYGKSRNWSGLRTVDYIQKQIKVGNNPARLSQHIGGQCNAIDMIFTIVYNNGKRRNLKANTVRAIIKKDPHPFLKAGLTTLEKGSIAKTWVHADCRPTGRKTILYVGK